MPEKLQETCPGLEEALVGQPVGTPRAVICEQLERFGAAAEGGVARACGRLRRVKSCNNPSLLIQSFATENRC